MNQITESHIIQLSSTNADVKNNGTMFSDVEFSFPGLLKQDPDIIQRNISVLHCQIPNSLYAITTNNNVLKFWRGITTTVSIPVGNYNANSIISAISVALTAGGITTITMSFNSSTGKLTFTEANGYSFYIAPVANSIAGVLGFTTTATYNSTAGSLTAPYPLNVLGAINLQICSRILQTKNYNSIAGGATTMLASIPISCVAWGLIDYTNQTNIRNTLTTHKIDTIDIQVFDNNGYLVDFNNQDWEITLVLDIVRKQPDVATQVFSNFLLSQQLAEQKQTKQTDEQQPPEISPDQNPIEDMEMFLLTANPQNILSVDTI